MEEKIVNVKPGRVNGKNSKYRSGAHRVPKQCSHEIRVVFKEHGKLASRKNKSVGTATQDKRESVVSGFISDLFHLGFKIESIHNLKQKHLVAVFNFLEQQGQSPSTIQNKISIIRVFCGWIEKNGMVGDSTSYVKDKSSVRRSMVAREDKSWVGNGIDVLAKLNEISQIDKSVGIWLELCLAFGLRVKEAILLRAYVAHGDGYIIVREGTKGGRPRVIPIENDIQVDVLNRAKEAADGKSGLLGVRGKTYEQKRNHFYYVLRKCDITLKGKGVTAHGLRHQYMHDSFKKMLSIEPPVKGGDLNLVDKDALHVASQKLVERAGHTRVSIGSSYYGSRRCSIKAVTDTTNTDGMSDVV